MRTRAVSDDAWVIDGYQLTGPAHIRFLEWRWQHPVRVSSFVVKNAGRGVGWFKFLRKIDRPTEWWVTHYKTRTAAETDGL